MKGRSTMALVGIVAAVGCENMGLDYAGPAEEARLRPPTDLVAAAMGPSGAPDGGGLVVDGRLWVTAGLPVALHEDALRPVGAASGQTVYARSWDQAPYDQLFTREGSGAATGESGAAGSRWLAYLPVIGGGGASARLPGQDVGRDSAVGPVPDDLTGTEDERLR